jgi:signal transduction histidine kinase
MDRAYVREKLLPDAYRSIPPAERDKSLLDWVVVAVQSRETGNLLWSSEPINWSADDRPAFDARKLFDSALNFHFLLVKLKDKSIEQISREFWVQNLILVLGLALVMFGGLLFTWRSVNREMELARLKSDFVSNVSHELKTPLALIRMFAETLELGRVRSQEKAQEYYTVMRRESERLTGLINNLLDFSRIEAGAKQYKFEPTSLPELVEQTLENYRYHLTQRGFELEEKIDRALPEVAVDREAYALCLLNLLDNAVKYSGEERFVAVRLERDNGSARLEVEDRGIGIQRKDQERIFEKFYRAGDPLVHNTKGSGLGLSLVRHVAQAHHGTVAVESAPGQGSRFILRVPLDDASRN